MSTDQVRLERRAGQRFDLHLPVSVRLPQTACEGCGSTQNLSARGALLHTDLRMAEGDPVGVTLVMPSMITLAENMRVRCHGKVLRVLSAQGTGSVVAVQVEKYEYLPETSAATSNSSRIGALHQHPHEAPRDTAPEGMEPTAPRP
jgi:PilZ domain